MYEIRTHRVILIRGYLNHNDACRTSSISRLPVLPIHPSVYEDALQRLKAGVILDEVRRANRKLFIDRAYKDMPADLSTSRYRWVLTNKDHRSLYRQFQRLEGVRIVEKDYINLHEWLDPNSPQFKKPLHDAIFHYKPRTTEAERLEVCIATSEMKEAAWKYAHHSQVLLDGTFGISDKKMLLFIVMGVDEANRGVPLAFLLFSAPEGNRKTAAGYNTDVLFRLLNTWREAMGTRDGEVFDVWVAITDTDLMERAALLRVFPHIILLICKFHLRQSWKNHRNRVLKGSSSEHDDIRQRLRRLEDLLVESEDLGMARALVASERETLTALQDANECDLAVTSGALKHLEYLDTYWIRDMLWRSWSRAGRLQAAVVMKRPVNEVLPTTNHLESFNSVLKRKHLRRWQNSGRRLRLDILVRVLILHALPSIFEQRAIEDMESHRWESLLHTVPGGSAIVNSMRKPQPAAATAVTVTPPLAYWIDDEDRDRGAAALVTNGQISIPSVDLEQRTYTFTCYSSMSLAQEKNPITYVITFPEQATATCTCPDFQKRGGACKHMRAAVVQAKLLCITRGLQIPDLRARIPNSAEDAHLIHTQRQLPPSPSSPAPTLHPIMRASITINEIVRVNEDTSITRADGPREVESTPVYDEDTASESNLDIPLYEDGDNTSEGESGYNTPASESDEDDFEEPSRDGFDELTRTNRQALNEQTLARVLCDLRVVAPKLAQINEFIGDDAYINKDAKDDIQATREVKSVVGELYSRLDRMLREVEPVPPEQPTLPQPARAITPPPPSLRSARRLPPTLIGPPVEQRAQKRKESYNVH